MILFVDQLHAEDWLWSLKYLPNHAKAAIGNKVV